MLFFAAVVVLTMMAAESFDPRLIWDSPARQGESSMADDHRHRDDLPQATVVRKKGTRISVVWIIPILAAVVAIGIAVQRIMSEGPTITIVFKAAEGYRGRQDVHQVQGRKHRPGDGGEACPPTTRR